MSGDETEMETVTIMDWGSDMAGFLAWRRLHPLEDQSSDPAAIRRFLDTLERTWRRDRTLIGSLTRTRG